MSFFSAFRIVFPGRIYGGPQTPLKSPSQISQHQGRAPIYHLFHGKNEETDIPMVAASDPSGELISWFLCWISWFLSHDRSFFLTCMLVHAHVQWFLLFLFLRSLDDLMVKSPFFADEITNFEPMKSPFLGLQPWKKALRTRCFKAGCSQRRRSFRLPWRKALVKGGRNLQKTTTGWCPSYKSGFNEQK